MRKIVGGVAVLVMAVAGCSDSTPAVSGSSTTRTMESASTTSMRHLGPEPGPAAYRALDLCALVPVATLRAAYVATGGTEPVELRVNGPSSCRYRLKDSRGFADLQFAAPRHKLPDDVRSTDPGVNKVDATTGGVIVYDPAVTSVYVLSSSGYLLHIAGSGDSADAQHLALALGKSARQRLEQTPPNLNLPDTAVSARDLCDVVRQANVVDALGLRGQIDSTVDGRLCELTEQFWVGFHPKQEFPPGTSASKVTNGSVTTMVHPDRCQFLIPIHAAPQGAKWGYDSLIGSGEPRTGSECERFIRALTPVVESLAG